MIASRFSSLRSVALGGLVSALVGLGAIPAQAASFTFAGGVPGGNDPLGGVYTIGLGLGGLVQFFEGAGEQPDPTQQVLFDPGASKLVNATSFTLSITGSDAHILPLSADFGNAFETYTANSFILSDWDASVSADGKSITYKAEPGDALLPGQRFSTFTTFTPGGAPLPANFSYAITWNGAVPEPATWAMMIGGFGLAGTALRRRRATAAFA